MPVSVSWFDDAKHAILQQYDGKWTWEELNIASQKTRSLADSVPYAVILFIEMSRASQMPQGNVLSYGRSAFNMMPTNLTHMVAVVQSQMMEIFGELILKMLPQWRNRVKIVKTVEEGERLVAEAIAENVAKSGSNG